MSEVDIRHWPSMLQRLIGKGALLNVVAVHSKQTHLPAELVESWYEYAIGWMKGLRVEPKSLAFIGIKGFEDATSYAFEKADSELRKRGFVDIPHISMEAAPPPGTVWLTIRQPLVGVNISCTTFTPEGGTPRGGSKIVWHWEHDRRAFSKEVIVELLNAANHLNLLDYASAFQDYSRNLPQVMEASASPFQERGRVTWIGNVEGGKGYSTKEVHEAGLHPRDFLREIYPYQILGPLHLSYRIGSQTLRDWITSSESHGSLEEFSEQRWLWTIPETQLKAVRATLAKNNLLTLYLPDMRRILEDYGRPQ